MREERQQGRFLIRDVGSPPRATSSPVNRDAVQSMLELKRGVSGPVDVIPLRRLSIPCGTTEFIGRFGVTEITDVTSRSEDVKGLEELSSEESEDCGSVHDAIDRHELKQMCTEMLSPLDMLEALRKQIGDLIAENKKLRKENKELNVKLRHQTSSCRCGLNQRTLND